MVKTSSASLQMWCDESLLVCWTFFCDLQIKSKEIGDKAAACFNTQWAYWQGWWSSLGIRGGSSARCQQEVAPHSSSFTFSYLAASIISPSLTFFPCLSALPLGFPLLIFLFSPLHTWHTAGNRSHITPAFLSERGLSVTHRYPTCGPSLSVPASWSTEQ